MKKNSSRRMRRTARSGFTLLEVMLVVGLLALLAALVIPNLTGRAEEAKKKLARSQVGPSSSLSQSIEQFRMDIGRWPQGLKDLIEKPTDEKELAKWPAGGYLKSNNDLNDPWGNEYKFQSGDQAKHNEGSFDLWSVGPDGQDGTDDDIGNWKKD